MIAQRTKAALQAAKARGNRLGRNGLNLRQGEASPAGPKNQVPKANDDLPMALRIGAADGTREALPKGLLGPVE
jgi:hypothetical protein